MKPTIGVLISPGTERHHTRSRAKLVHGIRRELGADPSVVYIDSSQTTPGGRGEEARGIHFPVTESGGSVNHWEDVHPINVTIDHIMALHTNGQLPSQTAPALRRLQRRIPTVNRMTSVMAAGGVRRGLLEAITIAARQLPFDSAAPGNVASILVADGEPFARVRLDAEEYPIYERLHTNGAGVTEAKRLLALLSLEMQADPSELVFGMDYTTDRCRLTIRKVDVAPQRIHQKMARGAEELKFALIKREARVLARMALAQSARSTPASGATALDLDIDAVLRQNDELLRGIE